jgi:hypothetical protein
MPRDARIMAQGAAEKNASIGLASRDRVVALLFAMPLGL